MWVAVCLQTPLTNGKVDPEAPGKLQQRFVGQQGIQLHSSSYRGEPATDVMGGLCHRVSRRIWNSPLLLLLMFPHSYSSSSTSLPVVLPRTAGSKAFTVTGSESLLRGDCAVFLPIPATILTEMQQTSEKCGLR